MPFHLENLKGRLSLISPIETLKCVQMVLAECHSLEPRINLAYLKTLSHIMATSGQLKDLCELYVLFFQLVHQTVDGVYGMASMKCSAQHCNSGFYRNKDYTCDGKPK